MPGGLVVARRLPSGCVCRRIRKEMECLKHCLWFLYAVPVVCVVWFLPVHGRGVAWAWPGLACLFRVRVWVVACGCVRVCGKGRGHAVVSPPCEVWVRRRATLPHPSGCSTIAVPGLSFRVRNGSGRLPWAMAAANPDYPSHGQRLRVFPRGFVWWVGDRIVDATEGMIHVTCRVSPCRPNDAFVCSCHPSWGDCVVLPFDC